MEPRLIAFVLATAVALLAHEASAETSSVRRIWIEARPWTCAQEAPALAREVELACDASDGRCHVAAQESEASHRAVLTCESPQRWVLRGERPDRTVLYSVVLEGDREERLRKAAMWTTRIDEDGAPRESVVPAPASTPPPAARVDSTAVTADHGNGSGWRGSSEGGAGGATPADGDEPSPGAQPKDRDRKRTGGLALDGAIGVTNSNIAQSFHGIHGALLFDVGPVHLGPAASLSQLFASADDGGFNGPHTADVKTVGARLGWGAPFTDSVIGGWLEAGVAWGEWRGGAVTPHLEHPPNPFTTPYGRAEIVLQVPLRSSIRPFAHAAGVHTVSQFGESVQTAMIGAGLAWRAW